MGQSINLCKETMENFLQSYDIIKNKYFWDVDFAIPVKLAEQALALENRRHKDGVRWDISQEQDIYLTIRKVYGNDEKMEGQEVIRPVIEQFLGDFVSIDGICSLYKASYFYFEWMMHLEYNPGKHNYTYYRDHYIHQIKNMYEMFIFLEQCGFMEKCIHIYEEEQGITAEAIRMSISEQMRSDGWLDSLMKESIQEIKGHNGVSKDTTDEEVNERKKKFYYRYLLHASAIVSSLVHDIGYPVTYVMRTTKSLHEYLPFSGAFIQLEDAVPHMEEILEGSLLFRVVDHREIAERITAKQDHGAISAVLMLSKYYENGEIYSLEPIKRMVIELSALVIYNHTIKYGIVTGKSGDLYRNIFRDNPMSYLFRLCDDLQEWGRVYFDISKKSNFLICPVCSTPVLGEENDPDAYSCCCGKGGKRLTAFSYRKLANIIACTSLKIDTKPDIVKNRKGDFNIITLYYDLQMLLQLALYNPTFAKLRADGILEVKKMLENQRDFPMVYIDTFISNNPITIKARCLQNYLIKNGYNTERNLWMSEEQYEILRFEKAGNAVLYNVFWRRETEAIITVQKKCSKEIIKQFKKENKSGTSRIQGTVFRQWEENLRFYFSLLLTDELVKYWRKRKSWNTIEEVVDFARSASGILAEKYLIRDELTETLIMEYILQCIRTITPDEYFEEGNSFLRELYTEQYLSNLYFINTVEEYTCIQEYDAMKNKLRGGNIVFGSYDYYTDYMLFHWMGKK